MKVLVTCAFVIVGLLLNSIPSLCQQPDRPTHGPGSQSADQEMMAGMEKMSHDMGAAPMTGDPDHDFTAMMIPHHQGAVDMALVELRHGHDPALRRLANEIIAAQNKEIAMMKHWQAVHPGR